MIYENYKKNYKYFYLKKAKLLLFLIQSLADGFNLPAIKKSIKI